MQEGLIRGDGGGGCGGVEEVSQEVKAWKSVELN